GYCNDADDLGGETCWGITVAEARANRYTGEMRHLPRALAAEIYTRKFWTAPRLGEVALLSEAIADELFDTGVNMGAGKAGEFLQMALNAFNLQGTKYPDVSEDGTIGGQTLAALKAYLYWRGSVGEAVMVRAINCLQGARYIEISRTRAANETFVYGWIKERVVG
ncbi:MAG TPA: putative peptidoglycan-binding domain-containing protein, partial [Rhodocyclaceae bacterium]|nr:putative peptidoglycan-binding domain-containing protein [Rhodocyclaceae bacterium]